MTNGNSEVLKSIIKAAKNAKDFLADSTKLALNAATDSSFFDQVPVVNAVIGFVGFSDAIMKFKLRRNTEGFLKGCEMGNPQELEMLYQKVVGDPRFRDEVPDTLMQILLDSHKPLKSEIVGRLFIALSKNQLNINEFNTLCLMVLNGSIPALTALPQFFSENGLLPYLSRSAIFPLEPLLNSLGVAGRHGNMFRISQNGQKLFEYGFPAAMTKNFKHEE